LDAQFIAALQILVYAGAIMVLFLFVIMLLNLGRPGPTDIRGPVGLLTAAVLAGALLLQLRVLGQAKLPSSIQLPPGTISALEQSLGMGGQVFVFFVMAVAAAEAAVGLAIILAVYRHKQSVSLQTMNLLKDG